MKMFGLFKMLVIIILFASGQAFAWTVSADFESGQPGAKAQGASGFSSAGSATTFSSDRAFSGTKSAKMTWFQGVEGFDIQHGEFSHPGIVTNGGQIWIRGYYFFASPWSWGNPTFNKILRLHVRTTAGANVGYVSIIGFQSSFFRSNEPGDSDSGTVGTLDVDRWQCLELYVNFSFTNPIVRIWKDGVLVHEDKSNAVMWNSTDSIDFSYIMSNWNQGAPQNQTQYLDAFVVTTDTPSAVDIHGNHMIGPADGKSAVNIAPEAPTAPTAPRGLKTFP